MKPKRCSVWHENKQKKKVRHCNKSTVFNSSLREQRKISASDKQNAPWFLSCCHKSQILVFQARRSLREKVKSLKTSKLCCSCLKARTAFKHLYGFKKNKKNKNMRRVDKHERSKFWRRATAWTWKGWKREGWERRGRDVWKTDRLKCG